MTQTTNPIVTLPPGSAKAYAAGCKCPRIDNHNGEGYYVDHDGTPAYIIRDDCPVHNPTPIREEAGYTILTVAQLKQKLLTGEWQKALNDENLTYVWEQKFNDLAFYTREDSSLTYHSMLNDHVVLRVKPTPAVTCVTWGQASEGIFNGHIYETTIAARKYIMKERDGALWILKDGDKYWQCEITPQFTAADWHLAE